MMFRLFGHYVSKLYLLLGVVEFLVMFYSMLAGFYMRVWVRERTGQWKVALDVLQ